MSDSAVLPSISPGSVGSNPTNPLHINFPSMTSQNGQASVTLAPNALSSLGIKPISNSSINTSLNSSHSGGGSGTPEPTSGSNGGSVKSETGSNGGPSPIPASVSNAISLIQAQQNAQNQNGVPNIGPPAVMGTNQTDYFRNCNVPNLINKWRRRHTWLFLKEGKMFCQACIDFKAVAKRYGRCDERNKFCNEGSTNFRSSAVEDHARSETHLRAVRATQQQNGAEYAEPEMGPSGFKQAGLGQLDNNPYGPSMVPQPSPFDRTPSRITPFNPDAFPSRDTLARAGTESDKIDIGEPSRGSTPDVHRKNQSPPVTNDSSSEERIQHLNVLLGKLRQQRSEGILCDVWVRYPNRQIQAHKALLSAASPVLAERLQLDSTKNSVSEIEVPEVKPAIFQQIIDFIYSGEIPVNVDTSQLLEAARFLQMKDLIQRLEKFEADLKRSTEALMDIFKHQYQNNKRKRNNKLNVNNNRSSSTTADKLNRLIKNSHLPMQATSQLTDPISQSTVEEIQIDEFKIEEISSCGLDEEEPPTKVKKEVPTEIEVKISDSMKDTTTVAPKPSPISGSSRRKGTSQRIAPSIVMNNDAPIDGVEEWLTNGKEPIKQESTES